MVSENFEAQLRWFARKLIEVRTLEVDGEFAPIDFDPAIISACESPSFDTTSKSPTEHVARMLKEIRGFIIKNTTTPANELSFAVFENGHVEISGYTTELLRLYFTKKHDGLPSLFGEGRDDERQTIVTYCDTDTAIHLGSNELSVFRSLIKEFGKDVSYEKLYEGIRATQNLMEGPAPRGVDAGAASAKEKERVRSAINSLEGKLKSATKYRDSSKIIESVRRVGYRIII